MCGVSIDDRREPGRRPGGPRGGHPSSPLTRWGLVDPSATFIADIDGDTVDDWVGHFPADDVYASPMMGSFQAQLASSQMVVGAPVVSFGSVADTDSDGLDDACDACPTGGTVGVAALGCL